MYAEIASYSYISYACVILSPQKKPKTKSHVCNNTLYIEPSIILSYVSEQKIHMKLHNVELHRKKFNDEGAYHSHTLYIVSFSLN